MQEPLQPGLLVRGAVQQVGISTSRSGEFRLSTISTGLARQCCSTRSRRMACTSSVADTVVVRELSDVAGGLARSYLFEDLTADELAPLAAVVTTRRLVRGESLCRVGERSDEIYVVVSGEVKDSVVDAAGVEVIHFLHGPGMTIGEPGFFAVDHDRLVELIAVVPSVVIRLGRRELEPFITRHPAIKDRILEKLASQTRWQTTMMSSLLSRSLTDRLVLRLLELVDSSRDSGVGFVDHPEDLPVDAGRDGRSQQGKREPRAFRAGGAGFDPS